MMPIDFIGRFQGFSAQSDKPRGNPIVWECIKNYFWRRPDVMEQIKLYHRSSPNLAALYGSVSEYDRVYTRRPQNDQLLDSVISDAEKIFCPPKKLKLLHINDMQQSDFPMNTSPCLPFVHMVNPSTGLPYKKKSECWTLARTMARRDAHFIKEGISDRLPAAMVFAKGKICTKDKIKSRAIWGKSFSTLIIQAVFFRELWKHYLKGSTPMAYGYTPFHRGVRKLQNDIERLGYKPIYNMHPLLSLDFSKYDTSIPPWLILKVYGMFAGYLDFSKYKFHGTPDPGKTKKLFWRLARECIDTRFRMPDGYEYQKFGGVDSGSFDFQLIECICTWIMINYALRKQGRSSLFCTVLGDDSLTMVNGHSPVDMQHLSQTILNVFGVEVNLEKSQQDVDLSKVKFLGRQCVNGLPRKETADVILAALWPSRTDRSPLDLAERLVALSYDAAGTSVPISCFLRHCWDHVAKYMMSISYNTINHPWSTKWIKKFVMWGLPRPPDLRLPNYVDLFNLVYCSKQVTDHTVFRRF